MKHYIDLAPCPLCESQQVQRCSDGNNPAKDFYRCRECHCQAPAAPWQSRPSVRKVGLTDNQIKGIRALAVRTWWDSHNRDHSQLEIVFARLVLAAIAPRYPGIVDPCPVGPSRV